MAAINQQQQFEPVRRSRLYEGIIEQVHALIADGRLKPGDQLPPERVLAETFGVSRTSVREALRALELRGLITGKQGGGTFVRSVSAEDLVRPMASALLAGKREIAELFELREMIEPPIARKAAERAEPRHLAELERILDQQRLKVERGQPYPDEDAAFHYTVAVAASNAPLLRLVDVVLELLRESRSTYLLCCGVRRRPSWCRSPTPGGWIFPCPRSPAKTLMWTPRCRPSGAGSRWPATPRWRGLAPCRPRWRTGRSARRWRGRSGWPRRGRAGRAGHGSRRPSG